MLLLKSFVIQQLLTSIIFPNQLTNDGWTNHDGDSNEKQLKTESSGEFVEANEINQDDAYQPVEGARGQPKYCTVNCLRDISGAEIARQKTCKQLLNWFKLLTKRL